jgi:hypothetical protein
VRLLREELHHLQEPGSYVGEVIKAMGKTKVRHLDHHDDDDDDDDDDVITIFFIIVVVVVMLLVSSWAL